MPQTPLIAPPATPPKPPNLARYEPVVAGPEVYARARAELDGLPGGRGLNIAYEAVDRHARGARANHVALRWLGRRGETRELTYAELARETSRFANALTSLGVGRGDLVASLLGRIPELYVAALGTLRNRSVFSPLFSAFGPEPIQTRLALGKAKALVTTEPLYARKVAQLRDALPELEHVILVGEGGAETDVAGTHDYRRLLASASEEHEIGPTDPEDTALVHFTSGTTGKPKGAVHVHEAIVWHYLTGKLALDLHPDDVFWCTADPGWVTGTSYGIISPLANGVTVIADEAEFDPERWYAILAEQRVSVWYTAPTAIRMLMRAGTELARERSYPALRFLASVGEPLHPAGVLWGEEAFGLPFHDTWWQTETGGIMIANFAATPIKPGSMGLPMPGVEAAIVHVREDGSVEVVEEPGEEGDLALRPGWPSMFRGYLGEPERYAKAFAGGWYITGDLARRDEDGYFWFVGRADDVIKSSGHLIGPFEVESVLLEHPAVAHAGVIGKPDPVAGEVVKAFLALKPGYEPSPALEREILAHARVRLGAVVAPKELAFVESVPATRSGKIMRRLLKARELGLPEGDTSTLETPE
ncbi:MAG: acetate--CoA ligase [Thermoleophilia bacterium]|nr:acetate--CoA ligase [Gaiellaceae bacterium]MDW8339169.1 acetate--CoA ligase [Thermoleophilia bacterium]